MKTPLLLLVPLSLVLTACGGSWHTGDFTVMSNRNISLTGVNLDKASTQDRVIGVHAVTKIFGMGGEPIMKVALEDALTKSSSDLLIDTSMYRSYWSFLGIVGQDKIEIKGTPVKTRGAAQ